MSLPLTVIGGFLGAGKTTLVNHLLKTGQRRWGVLVNDFGAVNIDAALIASQQGGVLELANGCICCSLGDDLGDGLRLLAERDPAPEHLLVEASGVSDPWRIAELALIEPGFDLQPLVVLADAASLATRLADRWVGSTVRRQIEVAELVALTRTDVVDPAAAAEQIRAIRGGVRIVAAPDGVLDETLLSFEPPPRPRASRLRADDPGHPFRSFTVDTTRPFDRDRLRGLLGDLPPAVLRVKGFCALGEEGARHVLQFAAQRWAFSPFAGDAPKSLVVIGTPDMPDPDVLAALFTNALIPDGH